MTLDIRAIPDPEGISKTCPRCKTVKAQSEFAPSNWVKSGGWCRQCHREQTLQKSKSKKSGRTKKASAPSIDVMRLLTGQSESTLTPDALTALTLVLDRRDAFDRFLISALLRPDDYHRRI